MATFTIEDAQNIGEDIGIDWDDVDFSQESFLAGLEVELEHGTERGEEVNVTDDDPLLTGMIAWAHLMEDPDYYELLAEMEAGFDGVKTEEVDPGMDRAEGATFRQSSIVYDNRVYVAKRRYEGPPLETGKTSIKGGAAPAVQWLTKQGVFQPGMKVLDWGAGKVARNADFLRSLGCEVYAYDPFNATGGNGWEMGSVAGEKPDPQQFDAGFSSFVLNVVPEHIEDEILRDMGAYTSEMYHIVRNRDIYAMAKNALSGTTNNPHIVDFFLTQFADDEEMEAWEAGEVYEEDIEAFCQFGFKSGPGKFQRIPSDLEDKGYRIMKETSGYTIYSNA